MKQLAEAAVACLLDYLQACGVPFDRSAHTGHLTGWANVNGRGHYNAPHRHPGHDLSGCFYLVQPPPTPDATDAIVFLDHRNLTREVERFGGPMSSTSFTLRPEPGQIVIFPSSLMHWVRPNQTDADRIVIAWNLDVVERGSGSARSLSKEVPPVLKQPLTHNVYICIFLTQGREPGLPWPRASIGRVDWTVLV